MQSNVPEWTSNRSALRQTARPLQRRRDLAVRLPPYAGLSTSPGRARVTFQSVQENEDGRSLGPTVMKKSSWDEESRAARPNYVMRERATYDYDDRWDQNSQLCRDTIATMLERMYGSDDQPDDNNTTTAPAQHNDDRWDEYPDLLSEWRRQAFRVVRVSGPVMNDGDQVIRVDGEDGNGTLLYDLASCRYRS